MRCSNCGQDNPYAARFCGKCGAAMPAAQASTVAEDAKSKLTAGLLGILLGWLGIHRFYLGYVGIGIAQIIVTLVTFGLGGIWGFIEGILILTGSINKDATGRPLKE